MLFRDMRNVTIRIAFVAAFLAMFTASCGVEEHYDSGVSFDAMRADANIFVAIGAKSGDEAYTLLVSAKKEAVEVSFCRDSGSQCAADASKTSLQKEVGDKKIFSSDSAVALSDGLALRFEAKSADQLLDHQIITFKVNSGTPTPVQGGDYDWRTDITFVEIQERSYSGNTYGSAYFKDIMTHMRSPYLGSTPLTNVHESLHFLLHENTGPSNTKFIYYRGGKGAYFPEPNIKTAVVEPYIPRAVVQKAKLYRTYVANRPTQVLGENIFDEWLAYITESIALVEIIQAGNSVTNDSIEGSAVEFLYFCGAAMQALLEKEPDHLTKTNTKAIFAMLAERTSENYEARRQLSQLSHAHSQELFDHLRTSPDGEGIRNALKQIYGAAWTQRVLGF